jgi:pyridoxal phosphate enzyme (YggS family)
MGVSKFQPLSAVEEAWNGGLRLFGESRVQEGVEKFALFKEQHPGCEIHLIGSLQRNKAKKAADFFDCIQSVDREPLIDELGALTLGKERPLMVFLEYHTGEAGKAGFRDLDSLCRGAEKVLSFPGLKPLGLMTIAPFTTDENLVRAAFRSCYLALEELKKRFSQENAWSCLSMGMSGDFEIALEEGATLIRIGTAIFGEREL